MKKRKTRLALTTNQAETVLAIALLLLLLKNILS